MFTRPLQFRTRAYRAPEEAPAASETDTLVFWSFHSGDERASEGFVYENELGGSYTFSKTLTVKIGWRDALDLLAELEAEADKKFLPVDEHAYETFVRLHRNDTYDRALPYAEHPLLLQEKAVQALNDAAEGLAIMPRRRKPPAAGGP
ncbi:MAG: hypothetical protein Q8K65_06275 [Alphaproteobacteria bacterium]|nr:hypothetical protein [Alphaproteobacteria bacterium]